MYHNIQFLWRMTINLLVHHINFRVRCDCHTMIICQRAFSSYPNTAIRKNKMVWTCKIFYFHDLEHVRMYLVRPRREKWRPVRTYFSWKTWKKRVGLEELRLLAIRGHKATSQKYHSASLGVSSPHNGGAQSLSTLLLSSQNYHTILILWISEPGMNTHHAPLILF